MTTLSVLELNTFARWICYADACHVLCKDVHIPPSIIQAGQHIKKITVRPYRLNNQFLVPACALVLLPCLVSFSYVRMWRSCSVRITSPSNAPRQQTHCSSHRYSCTTSLQSHVLTTLLTVNGTNMLQQLTMQFDAFMSTNHC